MSATYSANLKKRLFINPVIQGLLDEVHSPDLPFSLCFVLPISYRHLLASETVSHVSQLPTISQGERQYMAGVFQEFIKDSFGGESPRLKELSEIASPTLDNAASFFLSNPGAGNLSFTAGIDEIPFSFSIVLPTIPEMPSLMAQSLELLHGDTSQVKVFKRMLPREVTQLMDIFHEFGHICEYLFRMQGTYILDGESIKRPEASSRDKEFFADTAMAMLYARHILRNTPEVPISQRVQKAISDVELFSNIRLLSNFNQICENDVDLAPEGSHYPSFHGLRTVCDLLIMASDEQLEGFSRYSFADVIGLSARIAELHHSSGTIVTLEEAVRRCADNKPKTEQDFMLQKHFDDIQSQYGVTDIGEAESLWRADLKETFARNGYDPSALPVILNFAARQVLISLSAAAARPDGGTARDILGDMNGLPFNEFSRVAQSLNPVIQAVAPGAAALANALHTFMREDIASKSRKKLGPDFVVS